MLNNQLYNFDNNLKDLISNIKEGKRDISEARQELDKYGIEIRCSKLRVSDDLLYALREQGLTYKAIVEIIKDYGLTISWDSVRQRLKKIYFEKEDNFHKLKENLGDKEDNETVDIREQEKCSVYQQLDLKERRYFDTIIYNLKKLGLSNSSIKDEIKKYGVDISTETIRRICKREFVSKNKVLHNGCRIFEELYHLTNGNLNYSDILTKLEESNITVSNDIVQKIYLYTLVYEFKKQKLSCANILEELKKYGIITTDKIVRQICSEIYDFESNPDISVEFHNKTLDEQIYELKELGLSFQKIADKLKENGVTISRQRVEQRYKKYLSLISIKKEV